MIDTWCGCMYHEEQPSNSYPLDILGISCIQEMTYRCLYRVLHGRMKEKFSYINNQPLKERRCHRIRVTFSGEKGPGSLTRNIPDHLGVHLHFEALICVIFDGSPKTIIIIIMNNDESKCQGRVHVKMLKLFIWKSSDFACTIPFMAAWCWCLTLP